MADMRVSSICLLPSIIISFLIVSYSIDAADFSCQLPVMEGEEYLAFAEQMPEPLNGLPGIYKNITYPVTTAN